MIYYASRTGNVCSIIDRLALPNKEIQVGVHVAEPFLLFTYTDGLGQVPAVVTSFMEQHHKWCKGVIVSGNSNFGAANFCGAGDALSKQYNIPIIRKIELRGFASDDQAIKDYYEKVIHVENISKAQ